MGSRANVVIHMKENNHGDVVCLYTHHGAEQLAPDVAEWLSQVPYERHTDPPYLARMLFCRMVADDPMGSKDYGIDTSECGDADGPAVHVYPWSRQCVEYDGRLFDFDEFIASAGGRLEQDA